MSDTIPELATHRDAEGVYWRLTNDDHFEVFDTDESGLHGVWFSTDSSPDLVGLITVKQLKLKARVKELESSDIVDGMKREFIGEFTVYYQEFEAFITIPWATCKDIYKAMHEFKVKAVSDE